MCRSGGRTVFLKDPPGKGPSRAPNWVSSTIFGAPQKDVLRWVRRGQAWRNQSPARVVCGSRASLRRVSCGSHTHTTPLIPHRPPCRRQRTRDRRGGGGAVAGRRSLGSVPIPRRTTLARSRSPPSGTRGAWVRWRPLGRRGRRGRSRIPGGVRPRPRSPRRPRSSPAPPSAAALVFRRLGRSAPVRVFWLGEHRSSPPKNGMRVRRFRSHGGGQKGPSSLSSAGDNPFDSGLKTECLPSTPLPHALVERMFKTRIRTALEARPRSRTGACVTGCRPWSASPASPHSAWVHTPWVVPHTLGPHDLWVHRVF